MTTKYKVTVVWTDGASVKLNPNTGGSALFVFKPGVDDVFYASDIVPDSTDPLNAQKRWAKIEGGTYHGKYVAVLYPSVSRGNVRCTWLEVGVEEPESTPEPVIAYPDMVLVGPEGLRRTYIWDESIPLQ